MCCGCFWTGVPACLGHEHHRSRAHHPSGDDHAGLRQNGFLLTTERALHDQFGIEHATIQIETGDGELGVPLPADQSLKKAPRQSEGPYPAQKRSIYYQRNFKRTCMVRGLKFWLEVSDGNRVPKFGSLGLLLKLSLRPK